VVALCATTIINWIYEYGGTRTPDPQNRNLMLYPTELHTHTLTNHTIEDY
jgi:hypothetical protein